MIALHLSFHNGSPVVWAERGGRPIFRHDQHRRGRGQYPFDPGFYGLRDMLRRVAPGLETGKGNVTQTVAWLPTEGNLPYHSTPVLGKNPAPQRPPELRPWRVTSRVLTLPELLTLVENLAGDSFVGTGIVPDEGLLWVDALLRLSIETVVRERVLPGLVMQNDRWEARWSPIPDDEMEEARAAIASTMPPVCRCITDPQEAPPEISASHLVARLHAQWVDTLCRDGNAPLRIIDKRTRRGRRDPVSLHDAWLTALIARNAQVRWASNDELASFASQIAQWQRPVELLTKSPLRFCLRLSEPSSADAHAFGWNVEYLLQLKQDPENLIPVADCWSGRVRDARLKELGGAVTEFILFSLGQAAGLSPSVAASLKSRNPSGFSLDTGSALAFMREEAQSLREAGFSVTLPEWWTGAGTEQSLRISVQASSPSGRAKGGLSLDALFDCKLALSLGGDVLEEREMRALASMKAPLVKLRGTWVEINPEQLRAALRMLEQPTSSLSGREVLRLALGAEAKHHGLQVDGVVSDGWMKDLLAAMTGRAEFTLLEQPPGMHGLLRPYQQRGFSWLAFLRRWGLGACLADDMGLGKTVQTLALVQREREKGEKRPVLLVCPTSVVSNWQKEAEKFTPDLPVMIHHGPDRERSQAFLKAAAKHAMVVSSYGLLQRDVEILSKISWAGLVLDEAQNIKNPRTLQHRAARTISADYRIALTGTPVENHVGDLWAIMDVLNPGLLGSQGSFIETYQRPIQRWRDPDAATRLKRVTGPFLLRRLKTDRSIIADLPEKMEMKVYCTLTREQAGLYQAVLDEMDERLGASKGIQRRGYVLAALTKLKQVCNHPAHFLGDSSALDGRSGKLARLTEMLAEVRELNEHTLVFTQFAEMGGLLQKHIEEQFGEEPLFLHGAVPKTKRDAMVARFQEDQDAPKVFVLSLKAGGLGLNLTRATHVIHFDRWWNPAVENQATDRAFRIGQTRDVQVHKYIVAGTLEERIDALIERKVGITEQVVGAGEQWLTELSDDELRALLQLGGDAVGD